MGVKVVRYITVCRQCTLMHCNGECECETKHGYTCQCWERMPYANGESPCGDIAYDCELPDNGEDVVCAACGRVTSEGLSRFAVFREPPKYVVSVWQACTGGTGKVEPVRSVKSALEYAREFRDAVGRPKMAGTICSAAPSPYGDREILWTLETGPNGGLYWESADGMRKFQ